MGDTSWMAIAAARRTDSAAVPVAYGGDLDAETLLAAHRCGLLPMDAEESAQARRRTVFDEVMAGADPPVLAGGEQPWMLSWWSPPVRPVVGSVHDLRLSRNMRRLLRDASTHVLHLDVYPETILEELTRGRRWTWMTPRFVDAVRELADAGHYRAFALRDPHGDLVGGTLGVHDHGVQSLDSYFGGPRHGVLTVFLVAILCVRAGCTVDLQTPSNGAERVTVTNVDAEEHLRHLRPDGPRAPTGPPVLAGDLVQWLGSETGQPH